MKEFNEHVLKMKITKDKLKMEISLKDLVWLFENAPNNTYNGETVGVKVNRGKRQEFAEYVVKNLMDESAHGGNGDNYVWSVPFEEVFDRIIEGAEDDICKYMNDDE